MTLIVGIRCQGGVVLAADGVASYAVPLAGGNHTIQHPTPKLSIIGDNLIVGTSGPVGLGQSYRAELEEFVRSRRGWKGWADIRKARADFNKCLWPIAKEAWERAEVVAKTIGAQNALQEVAHQTVAAYPVAERPTLTQFSMQCHPEDATEHLPFLSIGSGQMAADLFLSFLSRVFWGGTPPSVRDGIFTAVWTIDHAIQAKTAGIGGDIQVVVLEVGANGVCFAHELSKDDLGEHLQMIPIMEQKMREARAPSSTEAPAEPIP